MMGCVRSPLFPGCLSTLIKGEAPGILTCEDDFAIWFDHLAESSYKEFHSKAFVNL